MKNKHLSIHPFCLLLPVADNDDRRRLFEDIKQHGVKVPVVLFEGQILDGRSRYEIAQQLGKPCPTTEFAGTDENALGLVASYNLYRRHLNQSQKAMVAAAISRQLRYQRNKYDRVEARRIAMDMTGAAQSTTERAERIMEESPKKVKQIIDGKTTIGKVIGRSKTTCPHCGHQW